MRKHMLLLILLSGATVASADDGAFTKGPVLQEYGPVADVVVTMPIPDGASFWHSFDVSTPAAGDKPNRTLESAARFINMHARAGVPVNKIQVAVVVHGKAVKDVAGKSSTSAKLVAALVDNGVRIIVCGQSAVYYGVATDDLLPGVKMALSAMTAHALLQRDGYTLNPF